MSDAQDIERPPGTALTVIPAAALPMIIAADNDGILASLAAKVAAFDPDISTPRGRDECRSIAYEIARAKTKLDTIGKGLTEEQQKTINAVNAERRLLREKLEELQDKVRAPLTEWEDAEKARVKRHEDAIAEIEGWATVPDGWTSAQIAARLEELLEHPYRDREWQEFKRRASKAATGSFNALTVARGQAAQREAAEAEAARRQEEEARRQREEAARLQAEREARIAEEAAEQARLDAERKATEEAAAAERRAQAERDAAAARERVAQKAAERERQGAAQRERDAADALARTEREKAEAEQRAKAAEERAERDRVAAEQQVQTERKAAAEREDRARQEAAEAERQRIEQQQAAERAAAAERERNVAHRRKINRDAAAAIVEAISEVHSGGRDEAEKIAVEIVTAIAKRAVPSVSISY